MGARAVQRAAAALALTSVTLFSVGVVLQDEDLSPGWSLLQLPVVAAAIGVSCLVGYLVATRCAPGILGWLLLGGAATTGLAALGTAGEARDSPVLSWVSTLSVGGGVLFTFVFLLFPDGRLPSPRWRPLAWASGAVLAVGGLTTPLAPGEIQGSRHQNPFGVESLDWLLTPATSVAGAALAPCVLLSVGSLWFRWRRGDDLVRRQVKWLALAAIAAAVALPLVVFSRALGLPRGVADAVMGGMVVVVFPATFGVALLRHRLFDIDLVLRRSAVFVVLWLAVALSAAGVTALFGAPERIPVAVLLAGALSLLIVILDPARRRVGGAVDRLVFGQTQHPDSVVAGFSTRLRSTDPPALASALAESVRTALAVEWARVTLNGDAVVAVAGEPRGRPALVAPIACGDAQLGSIESGPKPDAVFSDRDIESLRTLASLTGLALDNALLASRLVHAQEAERRRIERNLHDGVQQGLVALVAGLGLARAQANDESDSLLQTLHRLHEDALALQRDLRDLAQGIHPSVLTDGGLTEAIVERCTRLPVPVQVDSDGVADQRFADDIEGAAYFIAMEAITNALKHASPTALRLRLAASRGRLEVVVIDDGDGFDVSSTVPTGLTALADRTAALGGTLTVTSRPHGGTTVQAVLPASPVEGETEPPA